MSTWNARRKEQKEIMAAILQELAILILIFNVFFFTIREKYKSITFQAGLMARNPYLDTW